MQTDNSVAVRLESVNKSYGDLKAVNQLSFSVTKGQIFGLLGPNGAGKTTTLEMIEGLKSTDTGEIYVNGFDVKTHIQKVKEIIGVQLQNTSLYEFIKVEEALKQNAGYYKKSLAVDQLLQISGLEDKRSSLHKNLSGGQQQRLALALALINDPEILFLDEPTAGLDPQARRNLWKIVFNMRSMGKTVILTTHYMEEAEQLCDTIIIIDQGTILAQGAPADLISTLNMNSCFEFRMDENFILAELESLPAVNKIQVKGEKYSLYSTELQKSLVGLLEYSKSRDIKLQDLSIRQPNLEDLFIKLTGRSLSQ